MTPDGKYTRVANNRVRIQADYRVKLLAIDCQGKTRHCSERPGKAQSSSGTDGIEELTDSTLSVREAHREEAPWLD